MKLGLLSTTALGALLLAAPSIAGDVNWTGPSGGLTNDDANWDTNAAPATGDNAILAPTNGGDTEIIVQTGNTAITPAGDQLNSVSVSGDGVNTLTITHDQDSYTANNLTVGGINGGNTVYNLNQNAPASGSIFIVGKTDTGLALAAGENSTATFNQAGGTVQIGADEFSDFGATGNGLAVGAGVGSTGVYNLTGGSLTVGGRYPILDENDQPTGLYGDAGVAYVGAFHSTGSLYVNGNSGSDSQLTADFLNVGILGDSNTPEPRGVGNLAVDSGGHVLVRDSLNVGGLYSYGEVQQRDGTVETGGLYIGGGYDGGVPNGNSFPFHATDNPPQGSGYEINGGSLTVHGDAVIGGASDRAGVGTFGSLYQNAFGDAAVTVEHNLILGVATDEKGFGSTNRSLGVYSLHGGSNSTLTVDGDYIVGQGGNGTVYHGNPDSSAGDVPAVTVNGNLIIGQAVNVTHRDGNGAVTFDEQASGNGDYQFNNGAINVINTISVGKGGKGTLTQQGGDLQANYLEIAAYQELTGSNGIPYGANASQKSVYAISGGAAEIGNIDVGAHYFGGVDQTGGTVTAYGSLRVGADCGGGCWHDDDFNYHNATGIYNISAGALNVGDALNPNSDMTVGDLGHGELNQSGDSIVTVTGALRVGNGPIETSDEATYPRGGYVTLSGGSLTTGATIIGSGGDNPFGSPYPSWGGGHGEFTQTGGLHTTNSLILGQAPGGIGGNGSDADPYYLRQNSVGLYGLDAGALQVNGNEIIGQNGTGVFTQTGGAHNVTGDLVLGQFVNAPLTVPNTDLEFVRDPGDGLLILSGTAETKVGGYAYAGAAGKGEISVRDAASLEIGSTATPGALVVGQQTGSDGKVGVVDGNLTIHGFLDVGEYGNGAFEQTGGATQIDTSLDVGRYAGAQTGLMTVSGGTVNVGQFADVGLGGKGELDLSGDGAVTVASDLNIGRDGGSNGAVGVADSASLQAGDIYVGRGGTGKLTQSGGSVTATNSLNIGVDGTYDFTGGTLSYKTLNLQGAFHTATALTNAEGSTINMDGGKLTVSIVNVGAIDVTSNGGTFGSVTNNGTFTTHDGTQTFNGAFVNNGTYASDPAHNVYLSDFTNNTNGVLTGAAGDVFEMHGNFIDHSTQNTATDTDQAELVLDGDLTDQILALAGVDVGADFSGYTNNFAWGQVDIVLDANSTIHIQDGNTGNAGAALYTDLFDLSNHDLGLLSDIFSDFNIYYNADDAGNAWLGGLTYDLNGLGKLIGLTRATNPGGGTVPEPALAGLFGLGLAGLAGLRRKRK